MANLALSFSLSPLFWRVPKTIENRHLSGAPVSLQAALDKVQNVGPLAAKPAAQQPFRLPYELAGITAFGHRLGLRTLMPAGTFTQHALLTAAKAVGVSMIAATAGLTAGAGALCLSGGYFSYAIGAAIIATYPLFLGLGLYGCARGGFKETEKQWSEAKEFAAWRDAISTLPDKLGAANAAIANVATDSRSSVRALETFAELAPYLDRKTFFQPLDFRLNPPQPMRLENVSKPDNLPGQYMIDDVDTAWKNFAIFAEARLVWLFSKYEKSNGTTRSAIWKEIAEYGLLAKKYQRYSGHPAPWES